MIKRKPSKTGRDTAGRFLPGNKCGKAGRVQGSRNKTTILMQELVDSQGELVMNKIVERALAGDMTAARILAERLLPPRKDSPVNVSLPKISKPGDAVKFIGTLVDLVATGSLTPGEAEQISKIAERYTKSVEIYDLQVRIEKLEQST